MALIHKFQSSIPDGNDPALLQPSHWNDDHIAIDPAYPTRRFAMTIAIRNEGTAEEYIETLWTEI